MPAALTQDEAVDLAFLLGADQQAVGVEADGQLILSGTGDRRRIDARRLKRFEAEGWLRRAPDAHAFWRLTPEGFCALSDHFHAAS